MKIKNKTEVCSVVIKLNYIEADNLSQMLNNHSMECITDELCGDFKSETEVNEIVKTTLTLRDKLNEILGEDE